VSKFVSAQVEEFKEIDGGFGLSSFDRVGEML
jgi:hypothetical protein